MHLMHARGRRVQERAKAGELHNLASVNAYFDDLQHYQFIK